MANDRGFETGESGAAAVAAGFVDGPHVRARDSWTDFVPATPSTPARPEGTTVATGGQTGLATDPWAEHKRAGLWTEGPDRPSQITATTPDGESVRMTVAFSFPMDGGMVHVPHPDEAPSMVRVMPMPHGRI